LPYQIGKERVDSTHQSNDQNPSQKKIIMKSGELETILKDHFQAAETTTSKRREVSSSSTLPPQDEIPSNKYAKK
jgi:hypothetical protein